MPRRRSLLFSLSLSMLVSACSSNQATATSEGGTAGTGPTTSGPGGGGAGTPGAGGCSPCTAPEKLEKPDNGDLQEASGLVASRRNPGVLFAHNDSGDTARFFGLDDTGKDRGVYNLTGVDAIDFEAMSTGPCEDPTKFCLFIADIGDNSFRRTSYAVHRFEEPAFANSGNHSVTVETFRFRYPNGPDNAEAMFVDPRDGKLYILNKNAGGPTKLYELPQPFDASATVELVERGEVLLADLVPAVTAADMAPDGSGVLVRTYQSVWYFAVGPGETVAAALAKKPCGFPTPSEMQGETIAWAADGKSYRTLAEGQDEKLSKVSCSAE